MYIGGVQSGASVLMLGMVCGMRIGAGAIPVPVPVLVLLGFGPLLELGEYRGFRPLLE